MSWLKVNAGSLARWSLLGLTASTPAVAQTVARLATPAFNETLSTISRSTKADEKLSKVAAARTIVGVHYGKGSGPLVLDDIAMGLLRTAQGTNLCVRVLSRDGRYWALNPYVVENVTGTLLRFENSSKFVKDLQARFKAEDAVIKIVSAKDCQESAIGALIPAIPPGVQGAEVLSLYLNAPGARVSVRLLDSKSKAIAPGVCQQARNDVISHTAECRFALGEFDRRTVAKLQVTLVGEGATTMIVTSDIRLPE
jgi:hypothetical protein